MEKDEVEIKAWMIMRMDIIVCIMIIVFVLELRRGLVNGSNQPQVSPTPA